MLDPQYSASCDILCADNKNLPLPGGKAKGGVGVVVAPGGIAGYPELLVSAAPGGGGGKT